MIGKAEVTAQGANPRFVVTNLPAHGFKDDEDQTRFTPARLYEELYCARGEMENVLKQQTLDLQADRLSTHYLASNQLRLWLSTLAYLLLERVRTWGLAGTELAQATVGSIRLKLLKVAAQVRVSVRRVYVQLSSAYPLQGLFRLCQRRLRALVPAVDAPNRNCAGRKPVRKRTVAPRYRTKPLPKRFPRLQLAWGGPRRCKSTRSPHLH